ncbi:MAG TPA: hypothetical protein DDY88_03665 [Actinobacteria bacterium]|nr:hypothetical protein [Actinomycetota bacterium]
MDSNRIAVRNAVSLLGNRNSERSLEVDSVRMHDCSSRKLWLGLSARSRQEGMNDWPRDREFTNEEFLLLGGVLTQEETMDSEPRNIDGILIGFKSVKGISGAERDQIPKRDRSYSDEAMDYRWMDRAEVTCERGGPVQ